MTVGPLCLAASSPLMLQQSGKPWHYGRRREPLALPLRRRRRAPFLPPPTQAMALLHHAPTTNGSRRLGGSAAEGRSARRLGGGARPGDRLSLGPRQLLRRLHLRAVRLLAVEVGTAPSRSLAEWLDSNGPEPPPPPPPREGAQPCGLLGLRGTGPLLVVEMPRPAAAAVRELPTPTTAARAAAGTQPAARAAAAAVVPRCPPGTAATTTATAAAAAAVRWPA